MQKKNQSIKKMVIVSSIVSLIFSLIQKKIAMDLGKLFMNELNQININIVCSRWKKWRKEKKVRWIAIIQDDIRTTEISGFEI